MDTRDSLLASIQALAAKEHLIETNSGTYGPEEARRKVGSSVPEVAERNVYETVGGRQREEGPGATSAPGRMRRLDRTALDEDREKLKALRKAFELTETSRDDFSSRT